MKRQRGFTLVEIVITITVISIALVGTLLAINTVVQHSADPMVVHQAFAIADSYLGEISSKTFPTSLPCSGSAPSGGRINYATACDYKFLPVGGQVPTDQLGNPIAGLGSYNVQVNIDDTGATLQGLTAGASQVLRIDVTVSHALMPTMTFSSYQTQF